MTTYYLIRHGETEANKSGILQGHLDVPLSETGRKQSELAALALSQVEFDAIYSSDLSRAMETARIILAGQKKPRTKEVAADEGLRETHCGILQGKTFAEVERLWPEIYKGLKRDPLNAPRPGGESYIECFRRTVASFEKIRQTRAKKGLRDGAVAVVAHGGTIRNLLAYAKGRTVDPGEASVANCSISILREEGDRLAVVRENAVEHLLCMGFDPRDKSQVYKW
jgi:probable phosphoglycerate mutase